jgi:hypothetical protein
MRHDLLEQVFNVLSHHLPVGHSPELAKDKHLYCESLVEQVTCACCAHLSSRAIPQRHTVLSLPCVYCLYSSTPMPMYACHFIWPMQRPIMDDHMPCAYQTLALHDALAVKTNVSTTCLPSAPTVSDLGCGIGIVVALVLLS